MINMNMNLMINTCLSRSVTILLYNLALLICQAGLATITHTVFIFLGVLLFYTLVLFTADLFLAREITLGLISPYLVTVVAFAQVVVVNVSLGFSYVLMVGSVMLGFSVLIFLTKIVVDIQRCRISEE